MSRGAVRVPRDVRRAMIDHARRDRPRECCGFVVGAPARAMFVVAMTNVDRSRVRYRIDDRAHIELRARGAFARRLGGGDDEVFAVGGECVTHAVGELRRPPLRLSVTEVDRVGAGAGAQERDEHASTLLRRRRTELDPGDPSRLLSLLQGVPRAHEERNEKGEPA